MLFESTNQPHNDINHSDTQNKWIKNINIWQSIKYSTLVSAWLKLLWLLISWVLFWIKPRRLTKRLAYWPSEKEASEWHIRMTCLEWHAQNHMYRMTCTEWHVQNDTHRMTFRNITFSRTTHRSITYSRITKRMTYQNDISEWQIRMTNQNDKPEWQIRMTNQNNIWEWHSQNDRHRLAFRPYPSAKFHTRMIYQNAP